MSSTRRSCTLDSKRRRTSKLLEPSDAHEASSSWSTFLLARLRLVQLTCENKVSEMKSELKLKIFEVERAQLLNEETITNYHQISIENEKLQKTLEVESEPAR